MTKVKYKTYSFILFLGPLHICMTIKPNHSQLQYLCKLVNNENMNRTFVFHTHNLEFPFIGGLQITPNSTQYLHRSICVFFLFFFLCRHKTESLSVDRNTRKILTKKVEERKRSALLSSNYR
uniref:Putative secreted protein n=1 Tax=Ixodes ricinus TaxID=34613 RepID=A0A6B0UN86_IXORI